MWFYNVRNLRSSQSQSQGFTLLELVVALSLLGLLSAITTPTLVGFYNKKQVEDASVKVEGALKEAQRQAMRTSKTCSVVFDSTNNQVSGTCLYTGNRSLNQATIQPSATTLWYDFRGRLVDSSKVPLTSPVTIALSSSKTKEQRCVVVSAPLGLVRTSSTSNCSATTF